MKSLLSVALVGFFVACTWAQTTEPPDTDPECEDGYCCNAFCLRRNDTILPSIRWDCEIYSFPLSECEALYPHCNQYNWPGEPTNCGIPQGNNCEDMTQCCWDNFWATTSLSDVKPGETGIRNKWGDYFCQEAKRDASTPGLYWTLLFQGRADHCGRFLPNWVRLDDNLPLPLLCCNNLNQWDEECSGNDGK